MKSYLYSIERARRLKLWNKALDIYENAKLLGVNLTTVRYFASENNLTYKKSKRGPNAANRPVPVGV